LLFNLNSAIGKREEFLEVLQSERSMMVEAQQVHQLRSKPENLLNISTDKIVGLDVRDDIASGKDPLKKILDTVKQLKEDEVLHLINSFEPIPLYSVLGGKGFEHWTEKIGDAWSVYFYRSGKRETWEESCEDAIQNLRSPISTVESERIIELDVRDLPPPEPMMKILATLPQVDENTVLLVHHHREPMMLYDKLEERGYQAVSNKIEENYYKVVITKKK